MEQMIRNEIDILNLDEELYFKDSYLRKKFANQDDYNVLGPFTQVQIDTFSAKFKIKR